MIRASSRKRVAAWTLAGALFPRLAWAQTPPAPTPAPAPTPTPAPAQSSQGAHARATLDYAAPAELACPESDAFASAVATRLGYEPINAETAPDAKMLIVRYRRENAAVHVTLRLSNGAKVEAEKNLVSEAGSCAELGAAAAFAAAIMLDPRTMFPRPKPRAAPGATLDSDAPGTWPWYEPRSPLPPPAPAPPAPSEPWKWRAGLGAASCAGCAPSVNAGAGLFLGVAKGRLGLDAGTRVDLPASTTAASSARTVSASTVLGELFPHVRVGPARLGVVGMAGTLFGESDGEKQTSLMMAAGLRAAFEWRVVAPIFVRVALDGSVVLNRVSLQLKGVELWSTPALIAGGSLGVGAEFF